MAIKLVPAAQIDFGVFLKTFNRAYVDYLVAIQMEVGPMRRLIKRDAIDMNASTVAVNGKEPVGVGMLAIREDTGWIGGLGVLPDYRGRGIGRMITQDLLATARSKGLRRVLLEVIAANTPAHNLYLSLGFREVRKLLILERPPQQEEVAVGVSEIQIVEVKARQALKHYHRLHTTPNPWQRHYDALYALRMDMEAWVAIRGDEVLAYAVGWAMPETIRFMDIAMQDGETAALQKLLVEIHAIEPTAPASIVNLGEDDPIWPVLQSIDYQVTNTQWEMEVTLPPTT